jgi:hypothetical protein
MNSTLTALLGPGRTQHVYPCAATKTASPLTFVLQSPYTLTGCDIAGACQHRLIRSSPSRPADVAVAQSDPPPSCATVPGPVALSASRSMTFPPPPSVTVMIRPADDETTTPETGVRWSKQARHTSQMDRLRMRGEELAVAAPARPSGRDGVMASPPPPRRRRLLKGAGAAFQHALTASTVTYDQSEHCSRMTNLSTVSHMPTSLG